VFKDENGLLIGFRDLGLDPSISSLFIEFENDYLLLCGLSIFEEHF